MRECVNWSADGALAPSAPHLLATPQRPRTLALHADDDAVVDRNPHAVAERNFARQGATALAGRMPVVLNERISRLAELWR